MEMAKNEAAVSAAQMKSYDEYTVRQMGVPSSVLMERAALAAVDELTSGRDPAFDLSRVICVCGAGNNGGDGAAIARLLFLAGFHAEIVFIGDAASCSAEAAQQLKIAKNYGVALIENPEPEMLTRMLAKTNVTTIVDALFGIGLSRPITGIHRDAIAACNASPAAVLSVDIPSGISADTGEIQGVAVRADKTVVFAFQKLGMTVDPGMKLAGKTVVRDIGIVRPAGAEVVFV
jgi:NAD(P)H-hydrate epimerase